MKTYNKLVRDKIPAIIEQAGKAYKSRVLSTEEYEESLRQKLQEEVSEYLESKEPQELADILEVIYALAKISGMSRDDLEKVRQQKTEERGCFEERIFLETVDD